MTPRLTRAMVLPSSAVRQHATHGRYVGVGYLKCVTKMTLTLGALLRQDVVEVGLGTLVATLARAAETLGGAPVGLHLRHCRLRFVWPGTGHCRIRRARHPQASSPLLFISGLKALLHLAIGPEGPPTSRYRA